MKKFYTLVLCVIVTLILFTGTIVVYNKILDVKLSKVYNNNVASLHGDKAKNQGIALQTIGISNGDFMLFGSSELSVEVPQSPTKFFPSKNSDFIVNVVGTGYCQSLEHDLNIGALANNLKGKKIGIIISLQWFLDKDGIKSDVVPMNFSELQFYSFMDNKSISEDRKQYIATRFYQLLKGDDQYKDEILLAKLKSDSRIDHVMEYNILRPYFFFRKQVLCIKDKMKALKYITKNYKPVNTKNTSKNIDWQDEEKIAEQMGKKETGNNKFYVRNAYYNQYIKENLDKSKNSLKNNDLKESTEYSDFQELLKTCKEAGIRPYIILPPANGRFYDYMGLSKSIRDSYHSRIENIAKSNGFEVLNLKDKDYEPYFLVDIMHLGWKGWLDIDEKLYKYNK